MKRTLIIACITISSLNISYAQNCDCSKTPWTPSSCFATCSKTLLNQISKQDLITHFNISKETADKILKARIENSNMSLEAIKKILTSEEYEQVQQGLENANTKHNKFIKKYDLK